MPQISTVLIIRLDGIGDALALAPLLSALREGAIPVDLVLARGNAGIFAPGAARSIDVAPFALRSSTRENRASIEGFGASLAWRSYGAILVATEDPGGYRLARAIGAPRRIGFDNGWGKPLKTLWIRRHLTQTLHRPAGLGHRELHECEVLFELGRSLVGNAQPTKDVSALCTLLLDRDVTRTQRVAVQITEKWLRFGATSGDVALLLRCIARECDVHAIASAQEASLADAVSAASGMPVERFETLEQWKAAIAAARALVAPDSGATHVAGMVGTPAVAIFSRQAQLDRQVARWHPWAAPYRIVCIESEWEQRVVAALDVLLR